MGSSKVAHIGASPFHGGGLYPVGLGAPLVAGIPALIASSANWVV